MWMCGRFSGKGTPKILQAKVDHEWSGSGDMMRRTQKKKKKTTEAVRTDYESATWCTESPAPRADLGTKATEATRTSAAT